MSIAQNKKAFFDYFIEEKYEAGIVLEGWEVKAIRDNRVNLKEAYVIIPRWKSTWLTLESKVTSCKLPTKLATKMN